MKSFRYQFFTSIAAILVVSILVLGLLQTYLSASYFKGQREKYLEQIVMEVAQGARAGAISLQTEPNSAIDHMAEIGGAVVLLVDDDGIVTATTGLDNGVVGAPVPQKILDTMQAGGVYKEPTDLDNMFPNQQYCVGAKLVGPQGQSLGFVLAVSDMAELTTYLTDIMSGFVLSATLVLLVASLLTLLLTNKMVVPIQRISRAAAQFGEGKYSVRVPVEGDNELTQLAITFNDMANSFETTDASRRSFMGNIAHELRTPMTTIKGFVDGILDGTIPESERKRYLTVVSEEAGRLARLTKNMLDIARLETGEYAPKSVVFDIWKPIFSVLVGFEKNIEERELQIEGLEHTEPLLVLADEDYAHQILLNLFDNAIKFTNKGGTITIKAEAQRNYAVISIRNSGEGISPEALPHLFDRFYKEDKSRGLNANGSGLGLHICKVLTSLMGGRIRAASEEGRWSEFTFTLPLGRH